MPRNSAPPLIAGFRIEAVLGEGGMGIVYAATQLSLGRKVALKLLHEELCADAEARGRFLQEGVLAARIAHPHLVRVLEVGESEGRLFLAFELVEGDTLRRLLDRSGALPFAQVVEFARDCADALATLHRAGIVHRDLKPENLFLSPLRGLLVGDFGIAKDLVRSLVQTRKDTFFGTPHYMAPELLIRGERARPAADVYALGATIFECLTGRPPYEGKDPGAVLRQHLDTPIPDVKSLAPGVPAELAAIVSRALAKDPGERFVDGEEMGRALKAVEAPRAGGPNPTLRIPARRQPPARSSETRIGEAAPKPRVTWLVAIGALSGLALLAVAALLLRPAPVVEPPKIALPQTPAPRPPSPAPPDALESANSAIFRSSASARILGQRFGEAGPKADPEQLSSLLATNIGGALDACRAALEQKSEAIRRGDRSAALDCGRLLSRMLGMQLLCKGFFAEALGSKRRDRDESLIGFPVKDDAALSAFTQRTAKLALAMFDRSPEVVKSSKLAPVRGGLVALQSMTRWALDAREVEALHAELARDARTAADDAIGESDPDGRHFDIATGVVEALGYAGAEPAQREVLRHFATQLGKSQAPMAPVHELMRHWMQSQLAEALYHRNALATGEAPGADPRLFEAWVRARDSLILRWPYDPREAPSKLPTAQQQAALAWDGKVREDLDGDRQSVKLLADRLERKVPPEPPSRIGAASSK